MARKARCSECGGIELADAGKRRKRCLRCGATLAYRLRWGPYLASVALVAGAVGVIGGVLVGIRVAPYVPVVVLPISWILQTRFWQLKKV
jgi:hypothetical protein